MLAALACCALYVLVLGAARPEIAFLAAPATIEGRAWESATFAIGNTAAFPIPDSGSFAVHSTLEIEGEVVGAKMLRGWTAAEIDELRIGGEVVCAPCERGHEYPVARQKGALNTSIRGHHNQTGEKNFSKYNGFFRAATVTHVEESLAVEFSGNGAFTPNRRMPSSFYGVDAPFHIYRIPVLAGHLARGEWPSSQYTFLSVLPPAMLHVAFGVGEQYAYKLYNIALFFLPVLIFYIYSRKLRLGADAVFFLASAAYLFIPMHGYPIGGGPDLFIYGTTAHALATYLSLLFLYFAYEYVAGKDERAFAPSAMLFLLATASNQRILLALACMLAVLGAYALAAGRLRRAAVLAITCALVSTWFVVPLSGAVANGYAPLGGVVISDYGQALWALLQQGYVALPVFAAAGAAAAMRRREGLPVLLFFSAAAVFTVAMSHQLNEKFPFIDGTRFLPSIFLPLFFLSALAAVELARIVMVAWRGASIRGAVRKDDLAVGVALALFLPAAVVAFVVMQSTSIGQYSSPQRELGYATDYYWQEHALSLMENRSFALVGDGTSSQYPIIRQAYEKAVRIGPKNASDAVRLLRERKLGFLVLGNTRVAYEPGTARIMQTYEDFAAEPSLRLVEGGGAARVFELAEPHGDFGREYYSEEAEVDFVRLATGDAQLEGHCPNQNCTVLLRKRMPQPILCEATEGFCVAEDDRGFGGTRLAIGKGNFAATLRPDAGWAGVPPLAATLAGLLICLWKAGSLGPLVRFAQKK